MKKISCFLPYAGKEEVEKTVAGLQATGLVKEVFLITTDANPEELPGCKIIRTEYPFSSMMIQTMAHAAEADYA